MCNEEKYVFNKKIRFSRTIKFNPDVYEFHINETKVWGSNINVTQITIYVIPIWGKTITKS